MARFIPSEHSYGAEETLPAESTVTADSAATGGSFLRTFFGLGDDPRVKAKVLEAKIANLQQQAAVSPAVVRNFIIQDIKKKQAELEVLRSQSIEQNISDKSIVASKVGVSVLTFAGIGLAGLVGYNLWLGSKYIKSRTKS